MASIAPFVVSTSNTITNQGGGGASNEELLLLENSKLKQENVTLRQENEELKRQVTDLRKRKAASAAAGAGGLLPATKKVKTPAQCKKLLEKWTKAFIRNCSKSKVTNTFHGDRFTVEVKETIPWTMNDFTSFFDDNKGGTKIQPTPNNKPTSAITILQFSGMEEIRQVFPEMEKNGYKVQIWRARNFMKSYHFYDGNADLDDTMYVKYNKTKQTLVLEFIMSVNIDD